MRAFEQLFLTSLFTLMTLPIAEAHHGFGLEFDSKQPVTITGTFTKLEWANPHIFIHLDVKDAKSGKTSNWECEGAAPNVLYRKGWRKAMFVKDTQITIQGWRARKSPIRCAIASVKLQDGTVLESDYDVSATKAE